MGYEFPNFIGPVKENVGVHGGEFTQPMRCSWCGIRPTDRITSGTPECNYCWTWRKLDGPAARHWARVGTLFLSNVDNYDWTEFFPKAGLTTADARVMLETVKKLTDYCTAQIAEHDPNKEEGR